MPAKTVCVVGAGFAGIAALKESVRQGFKVTCYELDSDVGGIWLKKDNTTTNTPSSWDTLTTNTSKFNNCFSDFPPDLKDPVFLPVQGMYRYLKRAVEHFELGKFIQFNTRVIQIRKTSDHVRTGKWEVYTAKRGSEVAGNDTAGIRGRDDATLSKCSREVFDFVLVCTGHFKVPSYPDVPGTDTFKGTVLHSFHYMNSKPFEGQNVLVVGNKLSAVDIADDIATNAKQVYMALGEGTWILPRLYSNSTPFDLLLSRSLLYSRNPLVKINNMLMKAGQDSFDHETSGVRPARPPLHAGVALNNALPMKLMSGKVQAYGRLTQLQGDTAHFEDGKVISGINSVVFCTGYLPDFSFVDLDIIDDFPTPIFDCWFQVNNNMAIFVFTDENGKMELYRMMYPLREEHRTLAFIGNLGGDWSMFCLFETQARLATRVMAGKHVLPSLDKMKSDVDFWNAHTFERTRKYGSYFLAIALLLEMIAQEVGCYPSFWKVFWRSPKLAFRIWYGPLFSAQYRLVGPDSQWDASARSCLSHAEEGCSSLRHKDIKELHRPDIHNDYTTVTINLAIISVAVSVVGFLVAVYGGENIYATVRSYFA